jgi:hypothetical protein
MKLELAYKCVMLKHAQMEDNVTPRENTNVEISTARFIDRYEVASQVICVYVYTIFTDVLLVDYM